MKASLQLGTESVQGATVTARRRRGALRRAGRNDPTGNSIDVFDA